MSAPSPALSRSEPPGTQSAVPWPSYQYDGTYSFWIQLRVSAFPVWQRGSSLPGCVHPVTWLTLNLWEALNLAIVVW